MVDGDDERVEPIAIEMEESMWHIDDSRMLHFIIVYGDGIKRISVTPPAETSVDAMLGG